MKRVEEWKIAVVGAGTMGLGIAQLFATHGFEVSLYNRTAANLEKGMMQIRSNLQTMAELNEIQEIQIPEILSHIHKGSDLAEAVRDADYIVENVAEDESVKMKIFADIDAGCKEDAILASNTSTMNIFRFLKVHNMKRLAITHYFLPAYVIPLVELVRGPETSDETVEQLKALMACAGKETAVLNSAIPGFIVNRITLAIFREAAYIASMGYATPEDIDKAVCSVYGPRFTFGGPFGLCDFAGVDIYERLSDLLFPEISNATSCPQMVRDMLAAGNRGVKSGKGFYEYKDSAAASQWNAHITRMLQAIRQTNALFETKNRVSHF
ncbi:MAG: 3-hydroxyacyl-CoA dehydrogenase family protein [Clostridium sp.]|nr:3-hydroxyacyl-CoA dehydrogenase family protein [Clostridium sp.]